MCKDDKIDHLNAERQRMWELRKAAQAEAYKARACAKEEILKQRSLAPETRHSERDSQIITVQEMYDVQ